MRINNIDMYLDGGTIKIDTTEGIFYIDRRIDTETKEVVYNDYPKTGEVMDNSDEIKQKIYDAMEGYTHTFYKNMDSIRESIKPKQR